MATKNLSATITIGGTLTSGLKGALGSTKNALRDIGAEIGRLQKANKAIGSDIRIFDKLGRNVEGLRHQYAETVKTVDALRVAQKRLADAQARRDRLGELSGFHSSKFNLKGAGVGATVAGGAIIGSMIPGVNEAKHYQNEMARIASLGLGEEENKKAVKYAKDMKSFGVSQVEKLELMRDAMSIFGDEHHAEMVLPTLAKMKFGNAAVFGGEKGTENSQAFMDMLKVIETRGGLKSEDEFNKQANIIQRVISATGGRVGGTEWRHFLQQAGLIGKSMDSEALFYTMEHLVQEMGGDKAGTGMGSLYQSLYQGTNKTRNVRNMEKLGLIGDKSKVIHDKSGQTSKLDPGALLGADLFKRDIFAWMQTVLIPQLKKKGITSDDQMMDTFGMIASNTVGTRFLAEMYRQRDIIQRKRDQMKNAQDVDQLAAQGQEGAAGKELDAHAKLADAQKNLGENILPLYTKALVAASDALVTFNKFTEANPGLSNALVVGLTAIGGGLLILGPLLVAGGGILNAYAAMQLRAAAATTAATTQIAAQGEAAATASSKFGAFIKNRLAILALANVGDYALGKLGVGGKTIDEAQDDKNWARMNWWQTAESGVARGIEHAGGFVGLSNMANEAKARRIKSETDYFSKLDVPPMRGATAQTSPVIQQENNFNISQLPGESSDDLARRITEKMAQQYGVKQRSALTDGTSN